MVRRHNNQLADNLPQLQNLIKRDPTSYQEEFLEQYQHFQNAIEVFQLHPEQQNKTLEDLVVFMAQVSLCYTDKLATYPQQLIDILERQSTILNANMRMVFCRALILLRNKDLLAPTDLLELFFRLLQCQDKALRTFLESHIINDIKTINSKHRNIKLNTTLQNFMFSMLKDTNARAAKMSIGIMTQLYKKNVWNDAKTVNVIATGCFSKFAKVMVAALKFFIDKDSPDKDSDESDSENEVDPREVMMANKVNKSSRKRKKQLDKVKKLASKAYKKKRDAPVFNFSALNLIHDPQGMAEKLFKQLETTNKRFEIKIIILDVISRLIGLHNLFLLNFYPYIQRFFQPHQTEVTKILQFAAQASHDLVPPDIMKSLLTTLANNFITERNSSDAMAIGLNAVREICARCPLAIDEDLLRDLAQYKTYKDRSVMMAAKTLIHLFRNSRPDLLHKRDRGRPTEATSDLMSKNYGEIDSRDYVAGAEVLLKKNKTVDGSDSEDELSNASSSSSSDNDEEWIDIHHSSDEGEVPLKIVENESVEEDPEKVKSRVMLKAQRKLESSEQAHKVCLEKLLTDEDFRCIDVANIRKQMQTAKKTVATKRKIEDTKSASEFVKLDDIEGIYKKKKHDKQTRIDSVKAGQTDREKYGYRDGRVDIHCSKTNREKRKNKNFQMVKHGLRRKGKRSFKDKQISLRNHLLKLKKMK